MQLNPNKVILSLYAGAGGDDAQDWAKILERMYQKFAEKQSWQFSVLEKSHGRTAGIKSAVFEIKGQEAYNKLKQEAGVHRLVRQSPFNAKQRRHTSFALVEVLPDMGYVQEVKIQPHEIRVDTYRASGPGGQHLNVTDSAVRITHLSTGITSACQNQRSQAQNKEKALQLLKVKLCQRKFQEQKQEQAQFKTGDPASWGRQIRSYILHPYKMVRDERTGKKNSNVEKVLDGRLDLVF